MLDGGGLLAVGRGDGQRAEQPPQRGLLDVHLAERGQDGGDVAEEGPVGAEHQHARAFEAPAVRVQQEGGPVQPDRGLAGAGGALDADRGVQGGAYEVVLLGLDGGDDVAHGAHAGAFDLGGEDPAPAFLALFEALVLEARQGGARPAEAAAHRDALGVAGAGPVEGPGDGRAPVDHHGRAAVLAGDVAPADVVGAAAVLGRARPEVEPAEEGRPVGLLVELLDQALEAASQPFRAVAVSGHGLADDHVVARALHHPAQSGPALFDVPSLVVERAHRTPKVLTRLRD
ncbi:hypothetical protein ABGB14_16470 [Nonomuraea sp. B10E15]|uniref:hypothetical protein n=1 Tax=Nonomuraea sp. B10E15 TaxID=3153560 RepID=UPI00325E7A77